VLKFAAHQLIQDEVRSEVEFRIRTTDGVERFLRGTALKHKNNLNETSKLIGINWDVTDLRTLANELEEQHELLRVTLQSIGDAVITTDAAGNTVWLNPVAERMTGWTCDEAKGRPLGQIFHIVNEETRLKTENPVATCLEQGKVVGLANHTILISRSGDEFGIEDSAAPIISTNGDLLGVVLVFHDVTEQRRLSGEVNYRATHDALTGLVNRAEFENRLRRLLHSVHEDRSQHALMYIDLDQFKIVNDTCGHSVGDELLQQISKLFQLAVRTRDTLARLGGDEFAIILEHCTTEQAQRVAQQICDKMENYRFIHEMQRFRIGTSIGLVPIDNRWNTISMLMQAADTSCYAAKEAGRNRVHVWFDTDKAMRARHSETQWANRIELALDENRFELYAQHIISLADNEKGLHAELLLRMVERDGTIVTPDIFITAAERFHMASRIDRWVVRNAIMWLQNRPIGAPHIHTLAINLSGQSVGDRSFLRQLVEILTAAGSEICSKLCIEITETAAVTNMADAEFFIEEIHKLGLRISLDDFGAGSSSFGYLKNLSVDVLKIDGQFIRGILDDPLDDATVRCFVDVAKVVGLKTVAEFVNSPEILSRVKQLGVDYAQGYLIHKPEYIDQAFPLDIHFLNKSAI
jgi:diguanylate cyclase (GGDEF)-like protein/PAS domain S-box-containing protein